MESYGYEMEELMPVVAWLGEQYTGGESTSMTYERAQQLMEAVLYCIREYAEQEGYGANAGTREREGYGGNAGTREREGYGGKAGTREREGYGANAGNGEREGYGGNAENRESAGAETQKGSRAQVTVQADKLSAREAYQAGYRLVVEKVKKTMELYHDALPEFCSYGLRCLEDTFLKGIPEFFKWYDPKYNPQDTILTLDYPILKDLSTLSGVDAVYEYVKWIVEEQEALRQFAAGFVQDALEDYYFDYRDMVENISGILQWRKQGGYHSQTNCNIL